MPSKLKTNLPAIVIGRNSRTLRLLVGLGG